MLTDEQKQQYRQQGYLLLENVCSSELLAAVKERAAHIVNTWQDSDSSHIFTTKDNDRSGNDFFLDSAEEIRCFFEEEAFDEQGNFVQDRALCINKIGHALHELDPVFEAFSHRPILGEIAQDIGLLEPQIRQSMYIYKQPRIGGEVKWHQDASFFFTTPQSVVTYWFAIEDATLENGCLWVEPKGHNGALRERFNRSGSDTTMESLDNTPWPTETGIAVPVKAGSLVVFHGHLPHYSAPNRSSKSRQAYTLHVTDARTEYATENWLQSEKLPLRGFNKK
ncbi:phytanoyl-CoA dioxygenase family protein [Marinomonas agarivorans]|nr:phytanoyl-CoA dioxygenase family protein [Marinomonas agarivorans]